jgi:natural product precursor
MSDQSKKLELSKETLRSLDDQELTDVVGGNHHGGGGNNTSGICVSFDCNSFVCVQSVLCIL